MSQSQYKTMGIFPRNSLDKHDSMLDFLYLVQENGPYLEDISNKYEDIAANYDSFDEISLERLLSMGVIDMDEETIEITEIGDEIRQGKQKPLIEVLSDTFVGFYDTMALLSKASIRISTLKSFLNELHDVDWSANNEPKRRVDWLRDMDLCQINDANEYSLTEDGEAKFEELLQSRGSPPASRLFTVDDSEDESETVDQSSSEIVGGKPQGTSHSEEREMPRIPVIDRDTRKIFSFHVNKTDESIENYRDNVEEDTEIESVDWADSEELAGSAIRYWGINQDRFQRINTLTRGDCILFHHHDDAYMHISRVLTTQKVTDDEEEHDWMIVFEEISEAEISREIVFEIYDCEVHPKNTWIRIDDEELFHERYDSVANFIDDAGGTNIYEYWDYDHWDLNRGLTNKLERQLRRKNQAIIYGPPGTGKTFHAEKFAQWWTGKQEDTSPTEFQTESVTFHPAYSYEDFVEGYTITDGDSSQRSNGTDIDDSESTSGDSNSSPYGLKRGIFREFCERARAVKEATSEDDVTPRYVMVIDELNRGNVSQIFGENITILEQDKRGSLRRLSHSGDEFTVPENVYLIGTMNTADQSIARLDAAIRRRFSFVQLSPDCDVFYELNDDAYPSTRQDAADLIEAGRADAETLLATSILALEIINKKIVEISSLGKGKRIGHSYLLPETWQDAEETDENTIITDIWRYDILPLLEEYFFQDIRALDRQIFNGEEDFVNQSSNDIVPLHPQDLRDKLTAFVLDNQELLNVDFENE